MNLKTNKQTNKNACKILPFLSWPRCVNTLRPRQNGRHFADDIFQCIFLNENVLISIKNSLKFIPKGPINNIPTLVQIMAWRRPGDKPLSEPMMDSLLTHICVTRTQCVKNEQKQRILFPFNSVVAKMKLSLRPLLLMILLSGTRGKSYK